MLLSASSRAALTISCPAVILIQSLSTVAVIVLYPLQMTALYHRCLVWTGRYSKGLIEHRESVAMGKLCALRSQSQLC